MSDEKRPAELVWECAQGLMYKEAYSVLGSRTDSEDAVMEAMVRIVKNEEKFRSLGCNDMRALAVIYVRNTAIDIYNRNRRSPYPLEELPDDPEIIVSPEDEVIANDEADNLMKLIGKMPPSYRDVLLLKSRYDMDIGEIAELLNLEKGTVRTRLSRARAWLKKFRKEGGSSHGKL